MKKINKITLWLGTLLLSLSVAGCAAVSKPKAELVPVVDSAELECRSSCKLMAVCSQRPYSDHDLLICGRECLSAHPTIRAAVTECSMRWLRSCNREGMNRCVQRKLAPPKRQ